MSRPDLSREHDDPLQGTLLPFVIDRQRVVHSAAFRRLQHKTQVFLSLESDHFRTRMTHTLEVAHLARLLSTRLGLSADLAEVAALAHDLGHPPFGHAGEQALNECLRDEGGFEHNAHTLRVVEYLEHPYPDFRGLNLTRATRLCLSSHHTRYDRPAEQTPSDTPIPLESTVVDLADRLAYGLHDLQDGLYAGLIDPAMLDKLTLWRNAYEGPRVGSDQWLRHLRPAIDRIQRTLVTDAFEESRRRLLHPGDVPTCPIGVSPVIGAQLDALDEFLRTRLYKHERIGTADAHARDVVTAVFSAYVADPSRLPARFARRVDEQGAARVAADYVAGMTDRFCLETHIQLK
ncbi:MAG: dNTP triphosphohydrolase [Phycisphaerae bacterium]|nr:dNTP triphosphohydrolase [Phycisphaerae bacterium]